jgi:hypothetical protein
MGEAPWNPRRKSDAVDQFSRGARPDALGFYHEKKDEQRDVGLGPEQSSHAADAFGLMAI